MGMSDISWGAVLVGAAIAVAVVAFSPQLSLPALASLATSSQTATATYASAAIIGGIAGEFVSDLLGKTGNAISTIAGR